MILPLGYAVIGYASLKGSLGYVVIEKVIGCAVIEKVIGCAVIICAVIERVIRLRRHWKGHWLRRH